MTIDEDGVGKVSVLIVGKYAEVECNLARYRSHFNVIRISSLGAMKQISNEQLCKVQAIAFKGYSELDVKIMKKFPNLRIISNFGVGYDTINVEDAKKLDLMVTYTLKILLLL